MSSSWVYAGVYADEDGAIDAWVTTKMTGMKEPSEDVVPPSPVTLADILPEFEDSEVVELVFVGHVDEADDNEDAADKVLRDFLMWALMVEKAK